MTSAAALRDRRRWYAVVTPADLHPREGRLVSDSVLEVLGDVVERVEVDAYTDHEGDLGPVELRAQADLQSLGETAPGRMGDPHMAVELHLGDPVQRELAQAYLAWSIHAELWSDTLGCDVATFHDCSWSITLRLTDDEAAAIVDRVSSVGRLELLEELRRERRVRRRAGVAAAVRRLLRGR